MSLLITGPCKCGKSTLAQSIIEAHQKNHPDLCTFVFTDFPEDKVYDETKNI